MKRIKSAICLLLTAAMLAGLCACGNRPAETEEPDIEQTQAPAEEAAETEEPAPTDEPLSETILAEMEIFDAIDYSNGNFLTEAEFYDILSRVLALHDLEMTRYPGANAYFYFNYGNLSGVRLLTVAKTMEEIEADKEQAWADHRAAAEEYAAERQALASGETYEAPEETEKPEEEAEAFDASKDVENSQDYVISFVLSAADTEMDQQVMFLVSAAVWCILDPKFNNTDDAFQYLWRALYTTYGNSEGLSASTIDGIDNSMPFTIPGNGVEAWLGTDEAGNYILAITNYAVYDEIIDIAGTNGSSIQSAYPSITG